MADRYSVGIGLQELLTEVSVRGRRSQEKALSMKGALNARSSKPKVLLIKDRFIGNKSDRRFGLRARSGLEPQCCLPAAIGRFGQGNLSLNLPTPFFLKSLANQRVFFARGARDFT